MPVADSALHLVVPLPPSRPRENAGILRRLIRGMTILTAWGVALALLAVAMLRIFYHDGTVLLNWVNSFTLYVYLPAYVCLAVAWWLRQKILIGLLLCVVGFHLWWIAPDFFPANCSPSRAGASVSVGVVENGTVHRLRVYFHNVWGCSRAYDAVFAEIAENAPDVVVLAEYDWYWHQDAVKRGLPNEYPYNTIQGRKYPGEVVVYSKMPLRGIVSHCPNPWRYLPDVTVEVNGSSLRILGVHNARPQLPDAAEYHLYLKKISDLIDHSLGNLLVFGDFNLTQHSRWYAKLTAGRLRNAHRDRGRGYAVSWPNGKDWMPPIRIDHAFISKQVECTAISEGIGTASDHKPIILDLQIPVGR